MDFQFFLRDVICCLFHVDGNSMVAGTGQPWRCRGGLDGGCETGTRLGYGAFRGRNAANFFFSLLRRFGQQDEIHKHKQQSNPMEMLIEGFGSD
jgi:hypothetical protein